MEENKTPGVDFDNPESINAALEAEAASEITSEGDAPKKARKPAGPKVYHIKHECDRDYKAGDIIEFDFTVPKGERRGAVAGIPLEEMTDDQLKIEYRNANSVHYKTVKAGRDASKAAERLEKVKAEMAKRGIQPTARASATVDAATVANLIKSGKISVDDIQALLDAAEGSEGESEETGDAE